MPAAAVEARFAFATGLCYPRAMRRLGGVVVMVVALVVPGVAHAVLTAQTLAGSWTGTWKNLRFKTARGTFTIVISAPDDNTIVIDASQADFGCGALTAPVTLVKGVDWSESVATGTFGTPPGPTLMLTYDDATRTLTGVGANCHGSWTAKGRVKKNLKKFKAVTITTLTDTTKAKSRVKAHKLP
jgi:hypothetical protein